MAAVRGCRRSLSLSLAGAARMSSSQIVGPAVVRERAMVPTMGRRSASSLPAEADTVQAISGPRASGAHSVERNRLLKEKIRKDRRAPRLPPATEAPLIHEWLEARRRDHLPSTIDLSAVDPLLDENRFPSDTSSTKKQYPRYFSDMFIAKRTKKDPDWLPQVLKEFNVLPPGCFTPVLRNMLSSLMNYLVKEENTPAATVETILRRLIDEEESATKYEMMVTNALYTLAIDAWAKEGKRTRSRCYDDVFSQSMQNIGPERAEAILRLMHERYKNRGNKERACPNTQTLTAVLHCWAQSMHPDAPVRAEQILDWMKKLSDEGVIDVRPNVRSYLAVISAYAKPRGLSKSSSPEDAERLLGEMKKAVDANDVLPDSLSDEDMSSNINVYIYSAVIEAWSNSNRGEVAAVRASEIFNELETLYERTGDPGLRPNVVCLGSLLKAWSRSEKQTDEVERIFEQIKKLHESLTPEERENTDMRINVTCYNIYISSLSRSGDPNSASRAEEILNEMIQKMVDHHPDAVAPNDGTWSTVAQAFAQKGDGPSAERIMERRHEAIRSGVSEAKPTAFFYTTILNAWSKCEMPGSAQRAQRLLDWMEAKYKEGDEDVCPGTVAYTTVLSAWSRNSDVSEAAENALSLLRRMEKLYNEGKNPFAKPNVISYAVTLACLSKRRDAGAYTWAVEFLEHVEELHGQEAFGDLLNRDMYNMALWSCVMAADADSGSAAEKILERMEQRQVAGIKPDSKSGIKPDSKSYHSVISAYSANNDFGNAHKMLQRAKNRGIQPSAASYYEVLKACLMSNEEDSTRLVTNIVAEMDDMFEKDEKYKLSPKVFKRIMGKFAKERSKISLKAAEALLAQMDDLNDNDMDSKAECYAYALTICNRVTGPDSAKIAEKLLERMEDEARSNIPAPSDTHYELVLRAVAQAAAMNPTDDSAIRAEAIYGRLEKLGRSGNRHSEPSLGCFNALLRTIASGGGDAVPKLEEMIQSAERDFLEGASKKRPNADSYNYLLAAVASSRKAGSAQKCHQIIESMKEKKRSGSATIAPSWRSYSALLLACSVAQEDKGERWKNLQLAVECFNECRDAFGTPNNVMFNRLLMACIYNTSSIEDRRKMCKWVFKHCCEAGQVDSNFLIHFLKIASGGMKQDALGEAWREITYDTVPFEWKRNVKPHPSNRDPRSG